LGRGWFKIIITQAESPLAIQTFDLLFFLFFFALNTTAHQMTVLTHPLTKINILGCWEHIWNQCLSWLTSANIQIFGLIWGPYWTDRQKL